MLFQDLENAVWVCVAGREACLYALGKIKANANDAAPHDS